MRERRRLLALGQIAAVQRARRMGAEAALAESAEAEARSRREEEAAQLLVQDARQEWGAYLAKSGFSPQYHSALSGRIVVREQEQSVRAQAAAKAAEDRSRRELEWQVLEAQVRVGETSMKRLRRKLARRVDEANLAEAADRLTFRWSRS